jgi:hypothetical protein
MPMTSTLWRRDDAAAVEITALAAGAGPPANKIATRRRGSGVPVGEEGTPDRGSVEDDDMTRLRSLSC